MKNQNGRVPPRISNIVDRFEVDRPGKEAFWQPLYHYQTVAGTSLPSQMTFFQQPVGSNGLTKADTNVQSAGNMPSPKSMLVTNIQVVLLPSGTPGRADDAAANFNDVHAVAQAGFLTFFVASKIVYEEGPIGRFPVNTNIDGHPTSGAGNGIDYAYLGGEVLEITPTRLRPQVNFDVTLNFPGTTPVVAAGMRIGVILGGYQYRARS